MPNPFQTLFAGSFDAFKVFDDLTLRNVNAPATAPKTIWQVLNHVVKWQAYQLAQIKNIKTIIALNEDETWIEEELPANREELNKAVTVFKDQQRQLENELALFDDEDPEIYRKLKIVQDLSVHLSFHLGEVILMRRMMGTYPLPRQMKHFLS